MLASLQAKVNAKQQGAADPGPIPVTGPVIAPPMLALPPLSPTGGKPPLSPLGQNSHS